MQYMMNKINSSRTNYPNINQMIIKEDNKITNNDKNIGELQLDNNDNSKLDIFNVYFNHMNTKIEIECAHDELVHRVIEKFREKSNYKGGAKFIFNDKNLNLKLTIEQAGLFKNANIFVVPI